MTRQITNEELHERKSPERQSDKRNPIYVVLNDVRSLANVGVAFRWCDAVKVEKLFLCGITGYPPLPDDTRLFRERSKSQREIEKTAIKTVESVPWEKRESGLEVVRELKAQGIQIAVLEQTDDSFDYREAPIKLPVCLVAGHEREGVEQELLDISDIRIEIPLFGAGTSLNVSMALGLVLYKIVEQST